MSKYIEKSGNGTVLGGLGRLFDYECPTCHNTYSSKGSCTSPCLQETSGMGSKGYRENAQ